MKNICLLLVLALLFFSFGCTTLNEKREQEACCGTHGGACGYEGGRLVCCDGVPSSCK